VRKGISPFAAAAGCAVLRCHTLYTLSNPEFLSIHRNEYCCLERHLEMLSWDSVPGWHTCIDGYFT